jgi:hypothetical protein
VRQQLPRNRIIVGLWGANGDRGILRDRFGNAKPERIVTTLGEALIVIRDYERTVFTPSGRFSAV